jgi:AhpD family alkylhydroperoxidase
MDPAENEFLAQLEKKSGPNHFFRTMANKPEVLKAFVPLYGAIAGPGLVERRVKELVYLAASFANECAYCSHAHMASAKKAGVSGGLLYRYFPSKRAVVLALYEDLSAEYAARASEMPPGPWRERFLFALATSLEVLGPQRATLSALLPVLLGDDGEGLFAPATGFSRERVQTVFRDAVRGATDAIEPEEDAAALGRVLYVVHLALILCWLIDKSEGQTATGELRSLLERVLPIAAFALRLRAFADVSVAPTNAVVSQELAADAVRLGAVFLRVPVFEPQAAAQ